MPVLRITALGRNFAIVFGEADPTFMALEGGTRCLNALANSWSG
jgi:hypothetical protein